MSYDPLHVAFIDTETTGLDPDSDPVWEIAVIVDGVEHCWQQYIGEKARLHEWVNPWVLENTGILDRYDDRACLAPTDSIDRLIALVDGRHVVGACPWFDSDRLHRSQRVLTHMLRPEPDDRGRGVEFGFGMDLRWHYHLIDVENLAVGYLAGVRQGYAEMGMPWSRIGEEMMAVPELPWKSVDLSRALGVDPDDFQPKHSALADARWAKAMYEKIMGPPR